MSCRKESEASVTDGVDVDLHETGLLIVASNETIETAIAAWLDSKCGRSGSEKTTKAYRETLYQFRSLLWRFGLDLDGGPQGDMDAASLAAQGWANMRAESSPLPGRDVAASTYNQRLAILSSFYAYARKTKLLVVENPIDTIDRHSVQEYANAVPLDRGEVEKRLEAMDRPDLVGQRDYALLSVAFSTGRRAAELAGLRWGDIHVSGTKVTLTWRRGKGGKVLKNELGAQASAILMEYLSAEYGAALETLTLDAPVWVAHTRNFSRGGAISTRAIADIYSRRLGISKIHASRHTFAHEMMQVGAKLNELSDLLGHSNTATTGRYLKMMQAGNNPYVDKLERLLGIVAEHES
jgi:integrase